ncbi:hypothetical protein ACFLT9_06110 [Acidobacteriota bacterium]
MKRVRNMLKVMILFPCIFLLFSCNPMEKETDSNTMLIIESLTGKDSQGNTVNFYESDVVKVDLDSGAETIHADAAAVTLRARMLDPNTLTLPSEYNNIEIYRYTVKYFRSDGQNIEGTGIPYSFEGYLSARIDVDNTLELSVIIVRAIAKAETPLLELKDGRGDGVLTITARVDIYGRDLRDKIVQATGYLTIYFANYAD